MEVINPRVGALRRAATADPEGFWAEVSQKVPWRRPWEAVFEWDPDRPDERGRHFRWYMGDATNLAWNAVDRHVERGRGGVAALVCENDRGERQVITYAQLQHQVRQTAAALRGLGIGKGDRVPMTRSGKIMRRVLKAVTLGKDPGDISTVEDDGSVAEAREAWESIREELGAPAGGL